MRYLRTMTNTTTAKEYRAADPTTWEEKDSRQIEPTRNTLRCQVRDLHAGDAMFDDFLGVWRGITSVEVYQDGAKVRIRFEHGGGLFDLPADQQVYYSETGLRGWSSAAAASKAMR